MPIRLDIFLLNTHPFDCCCVAGRRWRGTQDEGHCVRLHQENLGRDVCLGLLLAVDQDCRGTHTLLTNVSEINVNKYYYWLCSVCVLLMMYLYSISTDAAPSGVINHCVRPLHRAVHHAVYRGQCAVHECGPLRRGVRRNVSITLYQPRIRFYLNHPEYGQITKINIKISCPCDPCITVLVLVYWLYGLLVAV